MSREVRLGAVLSGCLVYQVALLAGLLLVVLLAVDRVPAGSGPPWHSAGFWWSVLAALGAAAFLGGLWTGIQARGLEIRHALALVAFVTVLGLAVGWLGDAGADEAPLTVPEMPGRLSPAVFPVLVVVGALAAKAVRLLRRLAWRRQGYRLCRRCDFPLDHGLELCPVCGAPIEG